MAQFSQFENLHKKSLKNIFHAKARRREERKFFFFIPVNTTFKF